MKNNKLIHLLLQAVIVICLPALSFADITPLADSPDSCYAFNQPSSVIVVHVTGCPWSAAYMDVVSSISKEPAYQNWHYYELTFSKGEHDLEKVVCGRTISECPVTFIKDKDGRDSEPLHIHGALNVVEEQLKEALDEASSIIKKNP